MDPSRYAINPPGTRPRQQRANLAIATVQHGSNNTQTPLAHLVRYVERSREKPFGDVVASLVLVSVAQEDFEVGKDEGGEEEEMDDAGGEEAVQEGRRALVRARGR